MSARVRVAVLAGGRSSEHDISVASAQSVIAALDPERYETVVVEIDRGGRWALGSADQLAPGSDPTGQTPVSETLPVVADSA
ncbi:MAG: D-alanine--D-alanine ligase A, partial [Actinobacteria bacterium]|nr:D-alanine--D-alanine ligase A [Actinomycetota bacterium]